METDARWAKWDQSLAAVASAKIVEPVPDGLKWTGHRRPAHWKYFVEIVRAADGKAIRLDVPEIPAGLKAVVKSKRLDIEYCERGDHILVRLAKREDVGQPPPFAPGPGAKPHSGRQPVDRSVARGVTKNLGGRP